MKYQWCSTLKRPSGNSAVELPWIWPQAFITLYWAYFAWILYSGFHHSVCISSSQYDKVSNCIKMSCTITRTRRLRAVLFSKPNMSIFKKRRKEKYSSERSCVLDFLVLCVLYDKHPKHGFLCLDVKQLRHRGKVPNKHQTTHLNHLWACPLHI